MKIMVRLEFFQSPVKGKVCFVIEEDIEVISDNGVYKVCKFVLNGMMLKL